MRKLHPLAAFIEDCVVGLLCLQEWIPDVACTVHHCGDVAEHNLLAFGTACHNVDTLVTCIKAHGSFAVGAYQGHKYDVALFPLEAVHGVNTDGFKENFQRAIDVRDVFPQLPDLTVVGRNDANLCWPEAWVLLFDLREKLNH